MNKSKINKIGVEIEGGWQKGHKVIPKICGDGSIVTAKGYRYIGGIPRMPGWDKIHNVMGEIKSSPCATIDSIITWMKQNYPSATNASCGLHVHVSTKKREDYALLTDESFYKFFLNGMEAWGKKHLSKTKTEDKSFWKRLNGNNEFCLRSWHPLDQITGMRGKYTQLNFAAFREHRTMECRLLPAFTTQEKAILGVTFFVTLVHNYLEKAKPTSETKKCLDRIVGFP